MSGGPDLVRLYLSGEVRRWHANPAMARVDQSTADHQGRVAQLVVALFPEASPALIRAALTHDVGELVAGDVPQPAKAANATLRAALDEVEAEARTAILGHPIWLTEEEERRLKFCDRLEAFCFVALHRPGELTRPGSGWKGGRDWIFAESVDLGVRTEVARLVNSLEVYIW